MSVEKSRFLGTPLFSPLGRSTLFVGICAASFALAVWAEEAASGGSGGEKAAPTGASTCAAYEAQASEEQKAQIAAGKGSFEYNPDEAVCFWKVDKSGGEDRAGSSETIDTSKMTDSGMVDCTGGPCITMPLVCTEKDCSTSTGAVKVSREQYNNAADSFPEGTKLYSDGTNYYAVVPGSGQDPAGEVSLPEVTVTPEHTSPVQAAETKPDVTVSIDGFDGSGGNNQNSGGSSGTSNGGGSTAHTEVPDIIPAVSENNGQYLNGLPILSGGGSQGQQQNAGGSGSGGSGGGTGSGQGGSPSGGTLPTGQAQQQQSTLQNLVNAAGSMLDLLKPSQAQAADAPPAPAKYKNALEQYQAEMAARAAAAAKATTITAADMVKASGIERQVVPLLNNMAGGMAAVGGPLAEAFDAAGDKKTADEIRRSGANLQNRIEIEGARAVRLVTEKLDTAAANARSSTPPAAWGTGSGGARAGAEALDPAAGLDSKGAKKIDPNLNDEQAWHVANTINAWADCNNPNSVCGKITNGNKINLTPDTLKRMLEGTQAEGAFVPGIDRQAEREHPEWGQVRGYLQMSDDQKRWLANKLGPEAKDYFSIENLRKYPLREAQLAILQTAYRMSKVDGFLQGRDSFMGVSKEALVYGLNPMGPGKNIADVARCFTSGCASWASQNWGPNGARYVNAAANIVDRYMAMTGGGLLTAGATQGIARADTVGGLNYNSFGAYNPGGNGMIRTDAGARAAANATGASAVVGVVTGSATAPDGSRMTNSGLYVNKDGNVVWRTYDRSSKQWVEVDAVKATMRGTPVGFHASQTGPDGQFGASRQGGIRTHKGNDFATQPNTSDNIYAPATLKVLSHRAADGDAGGYRSHFAVVNPDGSKIGVNTDIMIAHLSKEQFQQLQAKYPEGSKIPMGSFLATSGGSGRTGSNSDLPKHLHYQTAVNGQWVDPKEFAARVFPTAESVQKHLAAAQIDMNGYSGGLVTAGGAITAVDVKTLASGAVDSLFSPGSLVGDGSAMGAAPASSAGTPGVNLLSSTPVQNMAPDSLTGKTSPEVAPGDALTPVAVKVTPVNAQTNPDAVKANWEGVAQTLQVKMPEVPAAAEDGGHRAYVPESFSKKTGYTMPSAASSSPYSSSAPTSSGSTGTTSSGSSSGGTTATGTKVATTTTETPAATTSKTTVDTVKPAATSTTNDGSTVTNIIVIQQQPAVRKIRKKVSAGEVSSEEDWGVKTAGGKKDSYMGYDGVGEGADNDASRKKAEPKKAPAKKPETKEYHAGDVKLNSMGGASTEEDYEVYKANKKTEILPLEAVVPLKGSSPTDEVVPDTKKAKKAKEAGAKAEVAPKAGEVKASKAKTAAKASKKDSGEMKIEVLDQ